MTVMAVRLAVSALLAFVAGAVEFTHGDAAVVSTTPQSCALAICNYDALSEDTAARRAHPERARINLHDHPLKVQHVASRSGVDDVHVLVLHERGGVTTRRVCRDAGFKICAVYIVELTKGRWLLAKSRVAVKARTRCVEYTIGVRRESTCRRIPHRTVRSGS